MIIYSFIISCIHPQNEMPDLCLGRLLVIISGYFQRFFEESVLCVFVCLSVYRWDWLFNSVLSVFVFSKDFLFHAVTHYAELRVLVVQSPALSYQTWFCYWIKEHLQANTNMIWLFDYCAFYLSLTWRKITVIHVTCSRSNWSL